MKTLIEEGSSFSRSVYFTLYVNEVDEDPLLGVSEVLESEGGVFVDSNSVLIV